MTMGKEAAEKLRAVHQTTEKGSPNSPRQQSRSLDWEEPEDDEELD